MTELPRLDPLFIRNPMSVLRRLQVEAPVSCAVMWGSVPVWLVTGYHEAKALLGDPRLSKDRDTCLVSGHRDSVSPDMDGCPEVV